MPGGCLCPEGACARRVLVPGGCLCPEGACARRVKNMTKELLEFITEKVKNIPQEAGCYLWLGKSVFNQAQKDHDPDKTQVLYVGKSINLRKRVFQYLNTYKKHFTGNAKTNFLLLHVTDIDWVVTNNEVEALLLENNLIKEHDPPYNVRLKDNKKYPFICLTLSEPFPRLVLTRKKKNPKNKYFGPYSNVKAARNTIAFIHRIFPIRKRALKLPLKKPAKPCINYHIKRCWAPCAEMVNENEYMKVVKMVEETLEGKRKDLEEKLKKEMKEYARDMAYEKASQIKDILSDMEDIYTHQQVHFSQEDQNFDVIALCTTNKSELLSEMTHHDFPLFQGDDMLLGEIVLLKIRYGKLISKNNFSISENIQENLEEAESIFLEAFLRDHYLKLIEYPEKIFLANELQNIHAWEKILKDRSGKDTFIGLHVKSNSKTEYSNLLNIASNNARSTLKERCLSEYTRSQRIGLRQIQKMLKLDKLPELIECYDISNLQGKNAVGAGVLLKNGIPHKAGYRKYKVKLYDEPNDPAMIFEVLSRRFARIARGEAQNPDLVLIDGGITQLNAAIKARRDHALRVNIASLAKKDEEIYLPNGRIIRMDPNSPGMLILRLARDEAHRFSLSYHRHLREKIS